ncbi:MAG: M3 family oligoendopeptidase [Fibrobacter sp.]|jgi:oligoendopeptidase F|nr:M3 family oligoendopeptidase [Fibrobacter sp.]
MNRHFVPEDLNPDCVESIEALYKNLLNFEIPPHAADLREWILRWSELESVLAEVSSRRYAAMTCNTADETAASSYAGFIENAEPVMNRYGDLLRKKMMQSPALSALEPEFGMWFRNVRVALELFNAENIPLETKLNQEIQAYQKITGAMSVIHEGKTKTLQQMAVYLESSDRHVRENTWRAITERRLQDKEQLDAAFDKLFSLRIQIAKNSGYSHYLDYIFKAKGRFDYTPEDCRRFHESIEKLILPLQKELYEKRRKKLGIVSLRPWDLSCDILDRAPLKPFQTGQELIEKCGAIFDKIHPQTSAWFRRLKEENLIDPESRLGKAPGGYQIGFDESRVPFIFMNAAGTDQDIYTLLHESGHAFHQFAMANQPIIAYRDIPSEFAEVASMSMELIGASQLNAFYPEKEEAARSFEHELEGIIHLFPWVASIDSFQHELYSRPNHTAQDRKEIWGSVTDRFDAGIDYSGLKDARAYLWQKQLHLFEVPFYYIEYGIAQLGALQVWQNFRKNPEKALRELFAAESLGSSRALPELFSTAGAHFDFSPKTIEPLVTELWDELSKY